MTSSTPRVAPSTLASSRLIGIGALDVVQSPAMLRSVLGSCVGVAIFDPTAQIAGLSHSILPTGDEVGAEPAKFADQAVDNLLARMLAAGAKKSRLVAKLLGCATMFGKQDSASLGDRNAEAARARLSRHGVPIIAESLGGTKGRKVLVDAAAATVHVEIIGESATVI
ncbi:MAG: chemotaxis protein CheD [Phycisphaerae bacterium]